MTPFLKETLVRGIDNIFLKYNLEDIRFKVEFERSTINIVGIREIDKQIIAKIINEGMKKTFKQELVELINRHSVENDSDTPDFVLAEYVAHCLDAFSLVTRQRDKFHGFIPFGSFTTKSTPVLDDYRWRASDELPPAGQIVEVKLENGLIKKGKYDKDVNRSCWLIEGSAGLYFRSLVNTVSEWRKIR